MRYGLLVTTHGDAPYLDEALDSFDRWVTPKPDLRMAVVDGPGTVPPIRPDGDSWWVRQHEAQHGFCTAVRSGWELAQEAVGDYRLDYVFWLENDFRFYRPVDVSLMAYAIGRFRHRGLCQMSLLRQPVSAREKKFGSVLATVDPTVEHLGWIEHRGYFTTNPSLIPDWLFEYEFPAGPECEGKFGAVLRDAGLGFGVWGEGDEWVEHLGERTLDGRGY